MACVTGAIFFMSFCTKRFVVATGFDAVKWVVGDKPFRRRFNKNLLENFASMLSSRRFLLGDFLCPDFFDVKTVHLCKFQITKFCGNII